MNDSVDQRIREGRIVQLVVTPPPEAVQVDEHVLPEFPLVPIRYSRSLHNHLYTSKNSPHDQYITPALLYSTRDEKFYLSCTYVDLPRDRRRSRG